MPARDSLTGAFLSQRGQVPIGRTILRSPALIDACGGFRGSDGEATVDSGSGRRPPPFPKCNTQSAT